MNKKIHILSLSIKSFINLRYSIHIYILTLCYILSIDQEKKIHVLVNSVFLVPWLTLIYLLKVHIN